MAMVSDRDFSVSLGCAVAYGMWVLALCVFGVGWVLDSPSARGLSVIVAIGAATATGRTYIVRQSHLFREAFEMGRDSVAPVSQIKR